MSLIVLTLSLSACGNKDDNQSETKPTLEVIKPTETEPQETLSDKLDDSTKELEIHGVYVEPDGSILSPEEAYEMDKKIRYENSPMLQTEEDSNNNSTGTSEENNSSTSDTDENSSSSSSDEGDTTSNSGDSKSNAEPTLSESEIAEGQRDFTDDEYEAIQNSIDEYTNKEAQSRMSGELDYYNNLK